MSLSRAETPMVGEMALAEFFIGLAAPTSLDFFDLGHLRSSLSLILYVGSQAAGSCGAGWGPGQKAEKPALQDDRNLRQRI